VAKPPSFLVSCKAQLVRARQLQKFRRQSALIFRWTQSIGRLLKEEMRIASAVSKVSDKRNNGFGRRVESQEQQGSRTVNSEPKPHVYKTRSAIK
jgi:hypothetical protein